MGKIYEIDKHATGASLLMLKHMHISSNASMFVDFVEDRDFMLTC